MQTETWHWLDTGAHDAAMNMAIDEALLERADERGQPLLRVYHWTRPSISIGYFLPYPSEYAESHEIVRRPTGGGLVFHGKDLTFTVIAPPKHGLYRMRAADSYREIHARVADALRRAGIPCELQQSTPTKAVGTCFELPVAHDIMVGGKKITGGAQRRTKLGLLHQGSLLLPPSLRRPISQLRDALRNGFGVRWREMEWSTEDSHRAAELSRRKYATESWNRKFSTRTQPYGRTPA